MRAARPRAAAGVPVPQRSQADGDTVPPVPTRCVAGCLKETGRPRCVPEGPRLTLGALGLALALFPLSQPAWSPGRVCACDAVPEAWATAVCPACPLEQTGAVFSTHTRS